MPLSGDTLLRIIRAIPLPTRAPARVIGLDDFALRKGRVYGTIFVDLEHHQVVDLVPERTAETVSTWLQEHAAPEVIARDRAQDYARGASDGAPEAIQVADRFHLLCNLREAVERALQRLTPALRQLLASVQDATVPPCETSAPTPPRQPRYGRAPSLERVQAARQAEREQRYQEVKAAAARGLSQRQIAAQVGLSTATIRTWLRTEALPADQRGYRARGKIDPYVGYLQGRLAEGCTNQTRLWQDIRKQGFTGTRSLVAKWIHAQAGPSRRTDTPAGLQLPSAKQLAWLIVGPPTDQERDAEEQRLWTSLQQHTGFAELHGLAQTFGTLVRQREATALDGWLERARGSASPEFRNFAAGLERDYAAIHAALTLPWSTGPVEGHINRLKLIKRSAVRRVTHRSIAPAGSRDQEGHLGAIGITSRRKTTGKAALQKRGDGSRPLQSCSARPAPYGESYTA
jgi:transposase